MGSGFVVEQRGFSLIELAVALAVIGVLVGAISVGSNLYRTASYTQIATSFVQGWDMAYRSYLQQRGSVPGDSDSDGLTESDSCNRGNATELLDTFLEAGVDLPQGRGNGSNHQYVYQDSNGNPQSIRLCLEAVTDWRVIGDGFDNNGDLQFVNRSRNALRLEQLTPSLARHLDSAIDGNINARAGRFREDGSHNTNNSSTDWSATARDPIGGSGATNSNNNANNDGQVTTVTAYYRMGR